MIIIIILIALAIFAFLVPVWWHGDIGRALTFAEWFWAHTRFGHPKAKEAT